MDFKETSNSYVFEVDMPGLKSGDIKIEVEDDSTLVIIGEQKWEEKMVRVLVGTYYTKCLLQKDANPDKIAAVCKDGVLTVTVEKLQPPPPPPKKQRKTIEVLEVQTS